MEVAVRVHYVAALLKAVCMRIMELWDLAIRVPKISRNLLSSSNTFRAPDSFDFCNAKYEKLGA